MQEKTMRRDWHTDMEMHRRMYLGIKAALHFPLGSRIGEKDLEIVLRLVKSKSKGTDLAEIEGLRKEIKYTAKEFDSIVRRLKMLGEIFDPYFTRKKEGRYLRLI